MNPGIYSTIASQDGGIVPDELAKDGADQLPELHFDPATYGQREPATLFTDPDPRPSKVWAWVKRHVLVTVLAIVAIVAGAVVAVLGLSATGEHGAAGVVSHDGYSVVMTLNHDQVVQAMTSGSSSSDAALFNSMFTDAALGTKGGNEEIAVGLTGSGVGMGQLIAAELQGELGNSGYVRIEGSYLVVSGPESSLGSFGGTGSTTN